MITRVRKLTRMNVRALNEVNLGVASGTTFVDFRGTPAGALRAVEDQMSCLRGTSTTYRSLSAVRRKLRTAAAVELGPDGPDSEDLTDYVTVTRTAQGETAAAYS
jgi:hypothetical protein